jgi:glyoxylase-like metal-dependent hydrolase (beta-lactamase superfamily II)
MTDRTTAPFLLRSFGDVEVGVYDAGRIVPHYALTPRWTTPDQDVTAEGHALMGMNAMTVRMRGALLAIDPLMLHGEHDIAPLATAIPGQATDVALAALGVDPDAVTHVLISHTHTDHVSGLLRDDGRLRFPRAEHLVPRADWQDFVVAPSDWPADHVYARVPEILRPVERAGLLRLVEGDFDVAPGVRLVSAPGETAGHQVVWIETSERPVLYLGDLVHYPIEMIDPGLALAGRDVEVLRAARLRVLTDAAATGAAVVYTHSRFPGWGTVERVAADSFRWRYATGA